MVIITTPKGDFFYEQQLLRKILSQRAAPPTWLPVFLQTMNSSPDGSY
jgi:hypothetical protein